MLIVSLVILVFLWHIPSAIVPIVTIPVAVLLAFIPMSLMGISSNIMSLAGIAISIGVLVDGAIVEVENAYKKLELWEHGGRQGDFHEVRLRRAARGGAIRLLLAARDRRRLPAHLHPRGPGGPALQAAGLDRRTWRWPSPPLLALTLDPALRMLFTRMDCVHFRPRWLALARQPGHGGPLLPGGEAPDQPRPLRGLRARVPLRAAPPEGDDRGRGPARRHHRSRLPRASATSSCRR